MATTTSYTFTDHRKCGRTQFYCRLTPCDRAWLLESVPAWLAPAVDEEGMTAVHEDLFAESSEGE
jgi:hypothetical protein